MGDKDTGAQYKISIENFVSLLEKWKKLNEEGVREIVIRQEDSSVIISGNY